MMWATAAAMLGGRERAITDNLVEDVSRDRR